MFKKIWHFYINLSIPVKASFWSVIIVFFQRFISILTLPLFTRIMDTSYYGEYLVYNSWLSILMIFCSLNLSYGVFNKSLIKYVNKETLIISSFQYISLICTVLIGMITIFIKLKYPSIINLDIDLLVILFIEIIFIPPLALWIAKKKFHFSYIKPLILMILISIFIPLINIFAVLNFEDQARAKILSTAIINIIVGLYFLIYNFKISKFKISMEIIKYGLWFNLPLIPHYLSTIILAQSDRIMIDFYLGNTKAAIYGVSYTIGSILLLVITGLNSTFVPWQYKELTEGNYKIIRNVVKLLITIIFISILLLNLVSPELLSILASKDYSVGSIVIPLVASSVIFIFLGNLFSNIEFYFEKRFFSTIASSIAAILNIGLNIFFIPTYGLLGAAITTLICYFVYAIAHMIFMLFILGNKRLYPIKVIIIYSLVIIVSIPFILILYNLNSVFIRWVLFFLILFTFLKIMYKNKSTIYQMTKL